MCMDDRKNWRRIYETLMICSIDSVDAEDVICGVTFGYLLDIN